MSTALTQATPSATAASVSERRGRAWLLWSFIVCPCHLPFTIALLGTVFGGTAFGTVVTSNTLGVGLFFGALYAVGLAIGFRHLRAATRGIDCSDGSCEIA
jgi:mercuric ion transport protein